MRSGFVSAILILLGLTLTGCGEQPDKPKTHLEQMGLQGKVKTLSLVRYSEKVPGPKWEYQFNRDGMIVKQTFYSGQKFDGYATFDYDKDGNPVSVQLYDENRDILEPPETYKPEFPRATLSEEMEQERLYYDYGLKDHHGNWTYRVVRNPNTKTLAHLGVVEEKRTISYYFRQSSPTVQVKGNPYLNASTESPANPS